MNISKKIKWMLCLVALSLLLILVTIPGYYIYQIESKFEKKLGPRIQEVSHKLDKHFSKFVEDGNQLVKIDFLKIGSKKYSKNAAEIIIPLVGVDYLKKVEGYSTKHKLYSKEIEDKFDKLQDKHEPVEMVGKIDLSSVDFTWMKKLNNYDHFNVISSTTTQDFQTNTPM